jgi:hypothetical protein
MSTPRYASNTDVSSGRSKEEIERTLVRYGASQFMSGWNLDQAVIGFVVHDRQIKFILPMPDRAHREFTHTPARNTRRTEVEIERVYEQAIKQRWRALALVIKAKLEAVEAGIVTFEDEFAMHMVLPGGRTVREHVLPAIDKAYSTGTVSFLAIEGAK